MMDNRLLQGLLIASGICLLLAIVLTWGEYKDYKAVGTVTQAPATARTEAPAADSATPAVQSDLLGVVFVDVQKALNAPLLQPMIQQQGGIPPEAEGMGKITAYIMPPPQQGAEPDGYAVIEVEGAALDALKQQMEQAAATKTVAGVQAFQAPDGSSWVALTDDRAIAAKTEQTLAKGIEAVTSGNLPAPAGVPFDIAKKYQAAAIRGGFAITDAVLAELPEEAPPMVRSARGAGFGITLDETLKIEGLMRFASAADAQSAADAVLAQLDQVRQQAQSGQGDPSMAAMSGLLSKVQVSASDVDCTVGITLNQQDFQGLVGMAQMMIMGAMMGGGMPGGAPGGGMPMMPGGGN